MPRNSLEGLIERRRREADPDSRRFASLQIDVYRGDDEGRNTGELLLRAGGQWDRRRKRFVGESDLSARMVVAGDQVEAFEWWRDWFFDHLKPVGERVPASERIYSLMLAGGQRGGKTNLGVWLAVLYALHIPRSRVWIVCPSDKDYEEVQDYLRTCLMPEWYDELGAPWYRFTFANGSRIVLRSGHIPQKLKKGDADFIVMNEAQQMRESAFAICRGRIAASGGQVVVCANPPNDPIGQWVGDFAVEAQDGLRQAKYFHVDPLNNPYIDHGPLLAMAKEFDDRTFDIEVRGMFLGAKNAALYNWSRLHNEAPTPELGDITREFTRYHEGREYDRIVGVDVQKFPHMASVEFRAFENPLCAGAPDNVRFSWCFTWAATSLILPASDEIGLAVAWLEAGWDPDRTLVVCDASGEWQFAERDPTKVKQLREEVKGRGSFAMFRKMGFRHIVKPDKRSEKNPDLIERFRTATSRISTKLVGPYGDRFVFSDPRNRLLNKAIRSCPTRGGKPDRTSEHAHACDAFTYPLHRHFVRRIKVAPEITIVSRREGAKRMRGW